MTKGLFSTAGHARKISAVSVTSCLVLIAAALSVVVSSPSAYAVSASCGSSGACRGSDSNTGTYYGASPQEYTGEVGIYSYDFGGFQGSCPADSYQACFNTSGANAAIQQFDNASGMGVAYYYLLGGPASTLDDYATPYCWGWEQGITAVSHINATYLSYLKANGYYGFLYGDVEGMSADGWGTDLEGNRAVIDGFLDYVTGRQSTDTNCSGTDPSLVFAAGVYSAPDEWNYDCGVWGDISNYYSMETPVWTTQTQESSPPSSLSTAAGAQTFGNSTALQGWQFHQNPDYDLFADPPTVVMPPPPPTGLSASSITETSAVLTWNAIPEASSYSVLVGTNRVATGVSGTSYTVTGLQPGNTYSLSVESDNAAGYSPDTSVVSVTTQVGFAIAFAANGNYLWDYWSTTLQGNNIANLGVEAGTSPSIAQLTDGTIAMTWTAPSGNVWYYLSRTGLAYNPGLGAAAGTSPSIAPQANGNFVIAWNASGGALWYYLSSTQLGYNTALGVTAGSSPSVAEMSDGNFVIAWNATGGPLWYYKSANGVGYNSSLGVTSGTSPSIAPQANGNFVIAWNASGGALWYYLSSTQLGYNPGLGLASGSSPSVVELG